MPYSIQCNTPLSNFEAGLDYRDVSDPAVMARPASLSPPSSPPRSHLGSRAAEAPHRALRAPLLQVSFPVVGDKDGASLIAWTTTPWSLPCNVALAVHPEFDYVKVG